MKQRLTESCDRFSSVMQGRRRPQFWGLIWFNWRNDREVIDIEFKVDIIQRRRSGWKNMEE